MRVPGPPAFPPYTRATLFCRDEQVPDVFPFVCSERSSTPLLALAQGHFPLGLSRIRVSLLRTPTRTASRVRTPSIQFEVGYCEDVFSRPLVGSDQRTYV